MDEGGGDERIIITIHPLSVLKLVFIHDGLCKGSDKISVFVKN